MRYFSKTELGYQTLQNRKSNLNARQRRLLVLIDTEDFEQLNPTQRNHFAPQTLITELITLGLIESRIPSYQPNSLNLVNADHATHIHTKLFSKANDALTPPSAFAAPLNNPMIPVPVLLSFEHVKILMIDHLQKYCGLMAAQHIEKIKEANDLYQLKRCQMQWMTLLQESRMSPHTLRQSLKQINLSLDNLPNHAEKNQILSLINA